ncbi:hypothetical protein GCM10020219_050820 [Nonomuraea dietziae]
MPVVALGDKGHDRRAGFAQSGHQRVVGCLHTGSAGRAERGELRVLQVELCLSAPEELCVLGVGARPAPLDESDAQPVQVPRDSELVGDAEVQALLLCAVSQRGVVDVEPIVGHRDLLRKSLCRKAKDPSRT